MARLLVERLFQRNCLSTEWIPLLRAAGHEAVHWSEVGDPRAPDTALMQWAIANGFAVFTHDLDFGTMLALSGADGPSVLQVRRPVSNAYGRVRMRWRSWQDHP
jgi:predicted nuclease of predicted toxin-antitoxin system